MIDSFKSKEKQVISADDLLPLLTYIVLMSNPANLLADVDYMSKYVRKDSIIG